MSDYLMRHGTGWKYVRAVPKDVRDLLDKKKFSTRCVGRASHANARAKARALAVKDDELFRALRTLSDDQKREIQAAGGLSKWKNQSALDLAMDKTPLIFLEAAAHVGRDDLFDSRADEVTKGEQAVSVLEARSVFDRKWRANEAKQHLLDKLDQKSVGKPRLFELIEI